LADVRGTINRRNRYGLFATGYVSASNSSQSKHDTRSFASNLAVSPLIRGARLGESLSPQERQKVTGILVEPSGTRSRERAVCAIYYSDPFLEGDGRVVLAEFKAAWAHRY
jgi:hypothetical protein